MKPIIYTFCLLLIAACASQTQIQEPIRASISAHHMGRTVELRQSCYYGDLYDENEKWLLSPYPFSETYHIVDLNGAPIRPQRQQGIIPAGTAFVVRQVEFPDVVALAKRMLTTPRYNPWIYLTPASNSTGLPTGKQFFILLLPMDLNSEEAVEKAIALLVSQKEEATNWLKARKPTIQVAIAHKEMLNGMSEEELIAAMGTPQSWLDEKDGDTAVRVAWYPSQEAWMKQGLIAEIKPARSLKAPAQPPVKPPENPTPSNQGNNSATIAPQKSIQPAVQPSPK